MSQTPEFEAIIKNCDKQRIVNFLKVIFSGNAKFGGVEQKAAEGITILGSVTLPTSDSRSMPILCCCKQMDGFLTERSSRRKQFDAAVRVLKENFNHAYTGNGPVQGAFTQGLFFFFDEPGNFRLSLVTAEISSGKMELNNYRRQSFFVEAGNNNKTFRTRLCKKIASFEELKIAFDVEKLSDEFFREYKVFYEDIVQYITGARYIEVKKNKYERKNMSGVNHEIYDQFVDAYGDDAERAVRNYVKKLMGRLVFIQFLQKKGWLGNLAGANTWNSGNRDFMQSLIQEVSPDDRENFIDNVLEEIFFGEFNTKENERHIKNATLKKYRFPFLNCGLFDRDADDKFDFKLPAAVFCNLKFSDTERKAPNIKDWTTKHKPYFNDGACGLFDFFDRFNFTIDENDPTDAEVSVDPEMLGKIFENLLEDNKDKGAFYTPKEIVNYMVNESLIAYLGDDSRNRNFVLTQETSAFTDSEKVQLDAKLAEVKICDPAIGSGAFPMGLLNLLCKCRQSLQLAEKQNDRKIIAALKRDIIQQNIYGVDIEKGAVDIARLRFWLSLIVDEETPEVLPNLEFKIMQGNSLLESYEGIDLSGLAGEKGARTRAQSKDQLSLVFDEKQAMDQIQKNLNKFYKTDSHAEKESLTLSINNNVKEYIKYIAPQKSKEIDAMPVPNDKFFLWHTYFRDVFNRKGKEGFDIVIGNPPYINANDLKKNLGEDYKSLKALFKTSKGAVDFYVYFFEKGFSLLKDDGILSFITPNKFLCANYGRELRTFLLNSSSIVSFWDVTKTQCFDASVYPIVSILKNGKRKKDYTFEVLGASLNKKIISSKDLSSLPENIWGFILSEKYQVVKKIVDKSEKITDFCKINATSTAGEADIFHSYIQNEQTNLKLVNTGTIDPYISLWGQRNLIDKGSQFLTPYLVDSVDILGENRYTMYHSPKIIIAKMALRLEGFFDENGCFASINTNCLYSFQQNPKFLLGWVHSKVFDTVYNCFFEGLKMAGGYLPFSAPYLSCMVIPKMSAQQQKSIVKIVDSILVAKQKNSSADTSKLEEEIDNLIYEFYDLSPEEIAAIEGSSEVQNMKEERGSLPQVQPPKVNDNFLQGEDL